MFTCEPANMAIVLPDGRLKELVNTSYAVGNDEIYTCNDQIEIRTQFQTPVTKYTVSHTHTISNTHPISNPNTISNTPQVLNTNSYKKLSPRRAKLLETADGIRGANFNQQVRTESVDRSRGANRSVEVEEGNMA
jgi:hypothetical protein